MNKKYYAIEFNSVKDEIQNTITTAGLTLDENNDSQLKESIIALSKQSYYIDTGDVNHIKLSRQNGDVEKITEGMFFIFTPVNDNTGPVRISVSDKENIPFLNDGQNMMGGEILTNNMLMAVYRNGIFSLLTPAANTVEALKIPTPVLTGTTEVTETGTSLVNITNISEIATVVGNILKVEVALDYGSYTMPSNGVIAVKEDSLDNMGGATTNRVVVKVVGVNGTTGWSNEFVINVNPITFVGEETMVLTGTSFQEMYESGNALVTDSKIGFGANGEYVSIDVVKENQLDEYAKHTIRVKSTFNKLNNLSSVTSELVLEKRLNLETVTTIDSVTQEATQYQVGSNLYTLSTDWNITLPYHNKYHRCNPFKETSTVDITGWIVDDNTLPEGLHASQVVLTDKYCYLLGGYNGSYTNKIYRANINSDGTISNWIIDNQVLPDMLDVSQVVLTDKYCYLLGGRNGSYSNKIYRANLNSDGTISNWIIDNQVLPEVLLRSQVVLTDKYCYLLGGSNGSYTNKIYRANINSDGTISNWIIDNQVLPEVLGYGQVVLTDKYCYLLGGYNGSAINKIYRANINSDGTISNWIIDTNTLLYGGWGSQVVQTKNRVWLIGIRDNYSGNDTNRNYVQYADITNGEIGVFTAGTSLPGDIAHHMVVVTKSRVYTFGSLVGSNAIYSAPFDGWEIYDTLYSTSVNEYVIDISDTSLSNAPESVFEKDTLTIDDSTTTTSLVLADEVKVGDVLNIDGVYTYEVTDVITAGVNFVVDISSLNLTEIPTVVYDNTSCIPITNISVTDSEGTIDYNQLDVESITIEPVTSNVNVQYAPIDLVGTVGKIKIQTTKAELNKIIIELDEATV
jgi:hypothetical protein